MSENSFFLAVQDGDIKRLNNIIEKFGININSQNNRDKESALTLAVRYKRNDLASDLIKKGINIHLQNSREDNALIIAASISNDDMVDILIERGIDVNTPNLYGDTALYMASHCGFLPIVEKLYNAGAILDLRDYCGRTALMSAVCMEQTTVVEFLIKKGARLEFQNLWNQTIFSNNQYFKFFQNTYTEKCYQGLNPLSLEEACFCKLSLKRDYEIERIIKRSRILCLFKILYHKYIFLDVQTIFQLVQTLFYENI
jgi:ankyrin repeat protein